MENEPGCPWTPNSGLKSFRAQVDSIDYDPVAGLLAVQSPMKLLESSCLNPGSQDDFRSPHRPTKRQRAPPSPATAMLLHAARVLDGDAGLPLDSSPSNLLRELDSSPGGFNMMGPFSPPSPAGTPSRLLFSPKSEPRVMQQGLGVSPASGMLTGYDGLLADAHGPEIIGSIWKHSEMDRRKNASSTARRPLLQQTTPMGKDSLDDMSSDPEPLPESTPVYKGKTSKSKSNHSEPRKDRKTYSTAGRPRVRGEYKCGKCGFYPKKSRHDCDEVKAKAAAGIPVSQQVAEHRDRLAQQQMLQQQENKSPSGKGTMLFSESDSARGLSPSAVAPLKLDLSSALPADRLPGVNLARH